METQAETLNSRLNKTDSADITIRHILHDNVIIEISGTIWRGESLKHVTFKKTPEGGIDLET